MDQAGIIRDLLTWLEGHLDQPLSLDNVAAKAGYSKWHLQRMFKEVTGHAIGAYIRARRLSKSAVALRLTARPILDIALQYRFDSQQTFTRAFKKQFAQTPALYRRSPDWSSFGMRPPLRLDAFTLPQAQFVTLPETHLVGVTQSYSCTLEQISDFRNEMRIQFWTQFLGNAPTLPRVLYGLHEPRPSIEKDDEQEVFYTTALTPEMANGFLPDSHPVRLEGGDYVQFDYEGPGTGLQEFILTIYGTCMPSLNLTRRKGQDIERFFPQEEARVQDRPMQIRCEYLIPVRR
ncbi:MULTISPECIES: MDR efflux pump AcrAB transcriptional activator RobA [Buttiauxella]|jgi:AraC family transcriptional activator of mar-sox-rob regulon|uniref:Right origin-binding protein n=1 Tax=Buttiauxella ferragutiae ATCC 51602 TaxID=1354252 RepID=A0ABX2WAB8_9ENTR|nr:MULTISPECIES: MDR efflux pump AcrAB transcriptional activator RobA [Buttiauxella]AYN28853.1 MDR efflux pump AcrAB transcriptional activator RobA [Buttiauxella sp. 3AFRM03]MCE0825761.1 MDR efflux pump AcrAB transcriptional activator RobA [Buttiauxella ferragutiae]OAT29210.1 right origin-binding protein [Buttiauxella ferragutiae ATCC 51602]TDN53118.1 AraC family transcriptional activator of mar-sox-rob regulon [Buttiauxella sp. JUb87]UNK61966.1 MDR efflux pump AcrAB transcriptional activator 